MDRKCKIVATIGPASQDYGSLEQLIKTGVNVIRLNFSHGKQEEHKAVIEKTREISARLGLPVGILQDLQGPKLRIGLLKSALILKEDELYALVPQEFYKIDTKNTIPIDIPELYRSVKKDDLLLFNDGRIHLKVQSSISETIIARVVRGGQLSSQQGLNFPDNNLNISSATEKDEGDLAFGLGMGVDAVAISFVRSAVDVIHVRKLIQKISKDQHPLLIAKLEKPEALDHLTEILKVSDGVMVARGDLGVEMDLEDVPVAQKRIIKSANHMNKLVITATQMLESMIHVSSPTRAEASDVANAIFDGTDMVMLSGETAIGQYPVETVSTMNRIICQSEAAYAEWGHKQVEDGSNFREGIALVKAARELALEKDVAAIAVFTRSGQTAFLMAKMRPQVPIVAFTPEEEIYYKLSFLWGVHPHRVPLVNNVEEMIKCVEIEMISSGMVNPGQKVVLIFGYPVGTKVPPNMTLIHKIEGNGKR
jgi:pyruvate kinase